LSGEFAISELEARKMQLVTNLTQSFFLQRLESEVRDEFELNADSKLFLLENLGIRVSSMDLGLLSATNFEATIVSSEGDFYDSAGQVYRPNDLDASARIKFASLKEDFAPGDLLMVVWSDVRRRLGLLNLTALSEVRIFEDVQKFVFGERDAAPPSIGSGTTSPSSPSSETTEQTGHGKSESLIGGEGHQQHSSRASHNAPLQSAADAQFDPISEIWSRAYGGSAAANSPWAAELAQVWSGPSSPGLAQAEELFRFTFGNDLDEAWMFLVGGPGSGKSTFASQFLKRQGFLMDTQQGMHKRHYMASHPTSRALRFVNDATVRTKGREDGLLRDMVKAAESSQHLLTCVNRGVIADELNLLDDTSQAFAPILDWIVRGSEGRPNDVTPIVEFEYMQVGRQELSSGGNRYIVVIYMDASSLLERQPDVKHTGSFESLECGPLSIQDGSRQNLLGSEDSPIALLLEKVSAHLTPSYMMSRFGLDETNPIVSNLYQLEDPAFREGLLSILRVAEIRLGSRLNYRAFWSFVARVAFGDLPSRTTLEQLQEALRQMDEAVSSSSSFSELFGLINLRTTEAIFEHRTELSSVGSFDPGLRFTMLVDPAMASSGELVSTSKLTSDQSMFIKPIAHAFQSAEVGQGILSNISIQSGNPLPQKHTPFDAKLDALFAESRGADVPGRLSNEQVARYSRYLLRVSSVFGGICHGKKEAQEWVSIWNFSPHLPQDDNLHQRVDTLLKPKMGRGDLQQNALISLLESRARPIIQTSESEPILAKALDNVQFSTAKFGADLFLVLKEYNEEFGRVKIDYSFLRELLNTSKFSVGVTEETYFVMPRLERTRSMKLIAAEGNKADTFALVVGDRVRTGVALSKNGSL
jgi:hypothetical protein